MYLFVYFCHRGFGAIFISKNLHKLQAINDCTEDSLKDGHPCHHNNVANRKKILQMSLLSKRQKSGLSVHFRNSLSLQKP